MNTHKPNHEPKQNKYSHKKITLIFVSIAVLVGAIALFSSGMFSGSSHSNMNGLQAHEITSEEQFILEMIPHHQEAVDSARMILAGTKNSGVSRVAESIVNTQTSEIEQLNTWKDDWYGFSLKRANYKNMMSDFSDYSGTDAEDRVFLREMVKHHEMAVMMAQQVLELNPRKEVAEFANEVIRAQSAEIAFMNRILSN